MKLEYRSVADLDERIVNTNFPCGSVDRISGILRPRRHYIVILKAIPPSSMPASPCLPAGRWLDQGIFKLHWQPGGLDGYYHMLVTGLNMSYDFAILLSQLP